MQKKHVGIEHAEQFREATQPAMQEKKVILPDLIQGPHVYHAEALQANPSECK